MIEPRSLAALLASLSLAACQSLPETVAHPEQQAVSSIPTSPPPAPSSAKAGGVPASPAPDLNLAQASAVRSPAIRIHFDAKHNLPLAEDQAAIEAIAQRLKDNPQQIIRLIGHANDNASAAYNLAIAERRADLLISQLRQRGVARAQIRREASGAEKNPVSCRDESCRQHWRSVEIRFVEGRSSLHPQAPKTHGAAGSPGTP